MNIIDWISTTIFSNTLLMIFLIIMIGFVVGRIRIFGIELGDAGVLLVALIFGHFGIQIPAIIKDLGLICFVTSVGFIAGPNFFANFKKYLLSYVLIGTLIILSGTLACFIEIQFFHIPVDLGLGMFAGALTSTPGLAAAIEATGSQLASIGYGIAYPFGVIGVVLFVQLVPKFLKIDIAKEKEKYISTSTSRITKIDKHYFAMDGLGFFAFALAVCLGLIIGKIQIPLPQGACFSFGTSGGPLIAGLLIGHYGHLGIIDLKIEKHNLVQMREFGLVLFLLGAGTAAGTGFVSVVQEYGFSLFIFGAIMTIIPMFFGFITAFSILKLNLFDSLGSITGGMTSTPALGTLINLTKTDDVANSYAATYPIALVLVVLSAQFISLLFL